MTYEVADFRVQIRQLTPVRIQRDSAVFYCEAAYRLERLEGTRDLPYVTHDLFASEIDVVSVDGTWKIADFQVLGLPIRRTFSIYRDVVFSTGDFTLVPRLAQIDADGLHLVSEFANGAPSVSRVMRADLRIQRRVLRRTNPSVLRGAVPTAPGQSSLFDAGWPLNVRNLAPMLQVEFVIAQEGSEAVHLMTRLEAPVGFAGSKI